MSQKLISYVVWNAGKEVQKGMDESLKCFGLTYVQFLILVTVGALNEENKFVTQQAIGEELQMHKNVVSRCLRLLLAKEYIARSEHPVDARAKIIVATDRGLDRVRQTYSLVVLRDVHYLQGKMRGQVEFRDKLMALAR